MKEMYAKKSQFKNDTIFTNVSFSSNWSQLQFLLRTGGSQEGVGQAPQHQAASLRREPVLLLAAPDQGYQATG